MKLINVIKESEGEDNLNLESENQDRGIQEEERELLPY